MAPRCLPELLQCLLLVASVPCESRSLGDVASRRHPLPMVSFLERLRGAPPVPPAPREPGSEAWGSAQGYVRPEDVREGLGLPGSPRRRPPRQVSPLSPGRGCHLGTCQTQNLASLLYHFGSKDLKDDSRKTSKGTADPLGYGRRRRGAAGRGSPTGT
ncbi:pro-adrenomedullin [Alligator mississippiensis]|uniref:pro-adrenomedullin n=1 Tax=Alligator mississippiensis TaxID=8496 RepID=UPI0028776A08|nr:pro-adrenomedullin [Alligator mississippiensis]